MATDTVKSHLTSIYRKSGTKRRAPLLTYLGKWHPLPASLEPLTGFWLSKFEFESLAANLDTASRQYRKASQINLERIDEQSDDYFTHVGRSLCSAPSSTRTFEHKLLLRLVDQHVVGIWENTNTKNVGCLQLIIHNDRQTMQGSHLGNASDGVVKSGGWIWRKIVCGENESSNLDGRLFKSYEELESLITSSNKPGHLIHFEELFQ